MTLRDCPPDLGCTAQPIPRFAPEPPRHGGNLAWAAAQAKCDPKEILDFSASINPQGMPPAAHAALLAAIAQVGAYPDPNYGQLRACLAQRHGVDPEWILPGNGAAELLTWAGRDLAALDGVLLPVPAFGDYDRALASFGARVVPVPLPIQTWFAHPPSDPDTALVRWLDALRLYPSPLAALERTLATSPGRWGLLLNNPHNPTGQLWARWAIAPLLDRLDLVVVDEAFMDFLPPEADQSLAERVANSPNLVVVRSLTKFYALPGLRLGYAIAHPDRLARWQQWRDPWPVNVLAAAAGRAALGDRGFALDTWAQLASARRQFWEGLQAIKGLRVLPGAANFLLMRLEDTDWTSDRLQRGLLERDRLLVRDCSSFGPALGGVGANPAEQSRFVRVAVRSPAENDRLLAALAAIMGR